MPSVTSPFTLQQPNRFIDRGDETVRGALVEHNCDTVGLLAMAIYEQHRRDWIQNYRERFGRAPDEYACEVFELAEHTQRRLAAYRQLAEARLAQSVSPAPVGATESFLTRYYRRSGPAAKVQPSLETACRPQTLGRGGENAKTNAWTALVRAQTTFQPWGGLSFFEVCYFRNMLY
jgi:hypothetical protein